MSYMKKRGGEDAGVFTTDVALLGSSVSCKEQRGGNGASLMEVDALHLVQKP